MENKNKQSKSSLEDEKKTPQATSEAVAGSNPASSQPKFNSKHSQRKVSPPETKFAPSHLDDEPAPAPMPNTTFTPQSQSGDNRPEPPKAGDTSVVGPSLTESPANQNVAPLGQTGGVQQGQDSKSGKVKKIAIALVLALLLALLTSGAFAAYAFYYLPQQAPLAYLQSISEMESGDYDLSLGFSREDNDFGSSEFNVQSAGSFIYLENDDFKLEGDMDLDVDFGIFSMKLNIDMIYADNTIYLRTDDTSFFSMFLPGLDSETWYSLGLDEETTDDLTASACSQEDYQAIETYRRDHLADKVRIDDAKRNGLFRVERDGERFHHYSGRIDGDVLKEIHQDLAEVTSDDCLDLDEETESNYEDLSLNYDLYLGNDHDELQVRIVIDEGRDEEVIELGLTTKNYNRDVNIDLPEDSRPLGELLGSAWLENDFADDQHQDSGFDESDFEFEFDFESESADSFYDDFR